jgi:hypothetical protein
MKFLGKPSIGSRVVQCGLTDRQTDVAKLIVALWNFANAPEKGNRVHLLLRCGLTTVFLVSLEVVIIQGVHGGGVCLR